MEITPKMIAKKLNAAADLLETKGWTNDGDFATTASGRGCDWSSRSAACFCVMGAINRSANTDHLRDAVSARLARFLRIGRHEMITWNDTRRSAKTVINALRGAAKQVLTEANGGTV